MGRGSRDALRLAYADAPDRRRAVLDAVVAEGGNVRGAARRLGVGWSTIRRWIDADRTLRIAVEKTRKARRDMKQLTINRARALGKDMNAKGIVILAFGDDGEFQAASYGRTKRDCGLLGKWLDRIYEAIESGEISDPFAEQQSEKRLTGPQSKLSFNDEGFEEHPDTDAAWLRGRL